MPHEEQRMRERERERERELLRRAEIAVTGAIV